jgi:hypothetical protein
VKATSQGALQSVESGGHLAPGRKEKRKMTDPKVLAAAEYAIRQEFNVFAKQPREDWFWDPRNRDDMMRAFAEWLARPREFASND